MAPGEYGDRGGAGGELDVETLARGQHHGRKADRRGAPQPPPRARTSPSKPMRTHACAERQPTVPRPERRPTRVPDLGSAQAARVDQQAHGQRHQQHAAPGPRSDTRAASLAGMGASARFNASARNSTHNGGAASVRQQHGDIVGVAAVTCRRPPSSRSRPARRGPCRTSPAPRTAPPSGSAPRTDRSSKCSWTWRTAHSEPWPARGNCSKRPATDGRRPSRSAPRPPRLRPAAAHARSPVGTPASAPKIRMGRPT